MCLICLMKHNLLPQIWQFCKSNLLPRYDLHQVNPNPIVNLLLDYLVCYSGIFQNDQPFSVQHSLSREYHYLQSYQVL